MGLNVKGIWEAISSFENAAVGSNRPNEGNPADQGGLVGENGVRVVKAGDASSVPTADLTVRQKVYGMMKSGGMDPLLLAEARKSLGLNEQGDSNGEGKPLSMRKFRAVVEKLIEANLDICQMRESLTTKDALTTLNGMSSVIKDLVKTFKGTTVGTGLSTLFADLKAVGKLTGRDLIDGGKDAATTIAEASEKLGNLSVAIGNLLQPPLVDKISEQDEKNLTLLMTTTMRLAMDIEGLPSLLLAIDKEKPELYATLVDKKVSVLLQTKPASKGGVADVVSNVVKLNVAAADIALSPDDVKGLKAMMEKAQTLKENAEALRQSVLSEGNGIRLAVRRDLLDRIDGSIQLLDRYLVSARKFRPLGAMQELREGASALEKIQHEINRRDHDLLAAFAGEREESGRILLDLLHGEIDVGGYLALRCEYAGEMIRPDVIDMFKSGATTLGAGQSSTVRKVNYQTGGGANAWFATKFTNVASAAYDENDREYMFLSQLGYWPGADAAKISHLGKKLTGILLGQEADSILTETNVSGTLEGKDLKQRVLLMELADGGTTYNVTKDISAAMRSQGEEHDKVLALFGAFSSNGNISLSSTDRFEKSVFSVMKEYNKLDWSDWLTGQGDRHASNSMVSFDSAGQCHVKGIDNDMSFPMYRVGASRIEMPRAKLNRVIGRHGVDADVVWALSDQLKTANHDNRTGIAVIDLDLSEDQRKKLVDAVNDRKSKRGGLEYTMQDLQDELAKIRESFGLQNMRKPSFITQQMMEQLETYGPDAQRWLDKVRADPRLLNSKEEGDRSPLAVLFQGMSVPNQAIYATTCRFVEMYKHALGLKEKGLVLKNPPGKDVPKERLEQLGREWSENLKKICHRSLIERWEEVKAQVEDMSVYDNRKSDFMDCLLDSSFLFFNDSGLRRMVEAYVKRP